MDHEPFELFYESLRDSMSNSGMQMNQGGGVSPQDTEHYIVQDEGYQNNEQ